MTDQGVILYGPPASGKDAVTRALVKLDPAFRHYKRLKAGTGRTAGYEMVAEATLAGMRQRGDVLYENARYGNRYVVDRPRLRELFDAGAVPVVHIGQVAGVRALTSSSSARWLTVMLWCSRETSSRRATERQSFDIASRLDAWDETERDVSINGTGGFALRIDTDEHSPEDAARLVFAATRSSVRNAR